MSFQFSWVLVILIFQIILWIIWQLKKSNQDSLFPDASEKVKLISSLNLDNRKIHWRNRIIMIG